MYRHLLVPVDATDLSVEVVSNAVGLARSLGARITFFHALPNHAASLFADAEVVRATAPAEFEYAYNGRARELLSKAEASARALGVPCDSMHEVSDKPAEAIVAAARSKDCDLIFMASHGRSSRLGLVLHSEMVNVLMRAGLPVLVAAIGDPLPPAHAIAIIRDEHRSLAAVMHAWMHALAAAHDSHTTPDPKLMRAMVRYIERFPAALHHPKEEKYLFKRLRERTSTVDLELEELERQHQRDHQLVADLGHRVDALEAATEQTAALKAARELQAAVERYSIFLWEHLGREEGVILPAALRYLTTEDWAQIDRAFGENRDPRFSGEGEEQLSHLFSRIVNLAGA